MAEPARRLFLALWPDEAAAAALDAAGLDAQRQLGGRRMHRDTLHITLAFLGGVEESRLAGLVEGLGGVSGEPFTLRLDQLAHWRHNHIVWAGCAERPAALDALVGALRQRLAGLGFAVDDTPFVPHVTLLRKVPRAEPLPAMGAIVWPVSGWVLMESRLSEAGASYRRLAGWPLALPGGVSDVEASA